MSGTVATMNTDVNTFVGEIPDDLLEQSQIVLALTDLNEVDVDALSMLPPTRIAELVLSERTEEMDGELGAWMFEQQRLWLEVEDISSKFTMTFDRDGLPGWRGQPWAMAIQSKWGAGLSEAVTEARAWLEVQ